MASVGRRPRAAFVVGRGQEYLGGRSVAEGLEHDVVLGRTGLGEEQRATVTRPGGAPLGDAPPRNYLRLRRGIHRLDVDVPVRLERQTVPVGRPGRLTLVTGSNGDATPRASRNVVSPDARHVALAPSGGDP